MHCEGVSSPSGTFFQNSTPNWIFCNFVYRRSSAPREIPPWERYPSRIPRGYALPRVRSAKPSSRPIRGPSLLRHAKDLLFDATGGPAGTETRLRACVVFLHSSVHRQKCSGGTRDRPKRLIPESCIELSICCKYGLTQGS